MANRFLTADLDEPIKCAGCNKDVFPRDRPVAALKGQWHPGCLKCTTCGITLSVRMLESYNNQPYCRAHRPTVAANQSGIAERADVKRAMAAPKAVRREQGVNKTNRMTFAPGKLTAPPVEQSQHSYVPSAGSQNTSSRRVQGVNKAERMTFAPGQLQAPAPPVSAMGRMNLGGGSSAPAPPAPRQQSVYNAPQQTYQEESYDEQPYEESYDQSYDQSHDQSYEQGGEATYTEENYGESYDDQGYDQSYDQSYEGGYAEGQEYAEGEYYEENYQEEQWQ
eukprot:TRINITY_DN1271_c0_g1_i1.p1 TRINITY_DN1271_c0_g1~~TRINITY_DN1271_c0_g1_i1.p1  ORF type:complete len:279 (+),score=75.50 TRINITY_DN1271_c0_g1_i1:70-906(+)